MKICSCFVAIVVLCYTTGFIRRWWMDNSVIISTLQQDSLQTRKNSYNTTVSMALEYLASRK